MFFSKPMNYRTCTKSESLYKFFTSYWKCQLSLKVFKLTLSLLALNDERLTSPLIPRPPGGHPWQLGPTPCPGTPLGQSSKDVGTSHDLKKEERVSYRAGKLHFYSISLLEPHPCPYYGIEIPHYDVVKEYHIRYILK